MPLLENIAEGLASAAGAEDAVGRIEKRKDQRQQLSDEERHANLDVYNQALDKLTTHIGQIDPEKRNFQNPEWVKLNDALHQTISARTALFHPEHGPGAMDKLAELLRIKKPERRVARTPGEAKASIADIMSASAGSDTSTLKPLPGSKPYQGQDGRYYQSMVGPDGKIQAQPMPEGYTAPAVKYSDYKEGLRRFVQSEGGDPDSPTAAQEDAYRKQRTAESTKPPQVPKVGSFGDFLTQMYGAHPTGKQYREGRQLWQPISQTVGVHTIMVPQPDGSVKPVQVEVSSMRGPVGSVSIPKTPGEAKKKVAETAPKSNAGVISVGETVGGKRTPAQNKAETEYNDAVKLSSLADQVAQKPNDAINQKRLAVALERTSAGRFTTQALDYIIKAGWGNTMEQWANNPSTGALPTDVMRQLVDGAHENLKAAKDAKDAAFSGSGGTGGSDMISVQIPGQPPGKIHASQKDAFLKKYPNATVQ